MLDQFLANTNIIKQSGPLKIVTDSAEIVRFPEMIDTGDYPKPIPFGGMGKPVNENGFSDHFPIAVKLLENE
jgi:hypothetical protein